METNDIPNLKNNGIKKGKDLHLSEREKEVLRWLTTGKTSWEIAQILLISERTVNYHVQNIIRKLDAVNRAHAVAIAIMAKLIEI